MVRAVGVAAHQEQTAGTGTEGITVIERTEETGTGTKIEVPMAGIEIGVREIVTVHVKDGLRNMQTLGLDIGREKIGGMTEGMNGGMIMGGSMKGEMTMTDIGHTEGIDITQVLDKLRIGGNQRDQT